MNELEQHLIFEFVYHNPHKVFINEDRSTVPGIDVILLKFLELTKEQVYEVSRNGGTVTKIYNDINELGSSKLFFNSLNMKITMSLSAKSTIEGGIAANMEYKYYGEDTKIPIDMEFNITAPVDSEFRRQIFLGIGHELTHAYNIWQWMMKNKKDFDFYNFNEKSRYTKFKETIFDVNNERALKAIHYRLSRLEMNAYIAQLRQELQMNSYQIRDSKSAMKAIKSTRSYIANYEYLERNIYMLNSITDKNLQQNIIFYTNYIAGKKFTNYNQVLKYYNERWFYYKKEYVTKASKIAFDIYSENHYIIDGNEI